MPPADASHPAVVAWTELGFSAENLSNIATLKAQRSKSAVYRLDGVGPAGQAVVAKRCLSSLATVERVVHENVLPRLPIPRVEFYGFVAEPSGENAWLLLGDAGDSVYDPNTPGHCRLAAQWLATVHAAARPIAKSVELPDRGAGFYLSQASAVRQAIAESVHNPALSADDHRLLQRIDRGLAMVEEESAAIRATCALVPVTLVHGDFVSKNIRLRPGQDDAGLYALDWETAGWGAPAADLCRSVGAPAAPDLLEYTRVVRGFGWTVDYAQIEELAALGGVFRMISAMYWAALRLSHPWIEKCMIWMRSYHDDMESTIGATAWGRDLLMGGRAQTVVTPSLSLTGMNGTVHQASSDGEPRVVGSAAEAEEILVREATLRRASRTYPDNEALEAFLLDVLRRDGASSAGRATFSRDRTGRSSTFANEVVTCSLPSGGTLRMLCKYARTNSHAAFGHRRGIEHEVIIYRDYLTRVGLSTPRYYGHRVDPATGEHWLAMEYLDGGITLNKGPQPASIISAAQWIGTFHARSAMLFDSSELSALIQYDRDYFAGWAPRVSRFAEPLRAEYPWLVRLCDCFVEFIPRLLALPQTLIHGEFTVHNVLLREPNVPKEQWQELAAAIGGIAIAPIDWESAAVSFGEIDLAFLIDGSWPEDVRATCIDEYRRARWGTNSPTDFEERFQAAEMYLHMRWLGDRPEKTMLRKSSWRFERLHELGRELGLI